MIRFFWRMLFKTWDLIDDVLFPGVTNWRWYRVGEWLWPVVDATARERVG